jgi:hypothetical protein
METAQVIDITSTVEVERKTLAVPEQAKLIVVSDDESMMMADNTKAAIKGLIKEVDSCFEPLAQAAFQSHRTITSKWKSVKAPLEEADKYLTGQVKTYLRKLEEEREAERKRLEDEARRQEEERRLEEAAALEAEAARLKAEGKTEEAEAITQEAAQVIDEPIYVPPVVMPETPRMDQRTYGITYAAELVDKMDLIRFVAKNPGYEDLLNYVPGAGNRRAQSQKESMKIDGLKLVKK